MPRESLPIGFHVDGRRASGETLALDAGEHVLVLTSCSADLGLQLRSTYMTAEHGDGVLVGESWAIRADESGLASRELAVDEDSSTDLRVACLYDHLQRLVDVALQIGCELGFEGVDDAVGQLDPASV